MSYFQGPVGAAVRASREGFKPLIVLLAGQDEHGAAAEQALLSQAESELMTGSILLRLDDDLASSAPCYSDARSFRTFCPTDALPTVAMVSPTGGTLALIKGVEQCCDAGSLHSTLSAAFQQVKQQQQAMLAAQAFAALAQRAQQQQQQQHVSERGEQGGLQAGQDTQRQQQLQPNEDEPMEGSPASPDPQPAAAAAAGSSEPLPPPSSAPVPAAAAALALRVRLPSGTTLQLELEGGATLGEVFAAVDAQRSVAGHAGQAPYLLVTSPPARRQLGSGEAALTLRQLGITHNSLLTLAPNPGGHRPAPAVPALHAGPGASSAGGAQGGAAGTAAPAAPADAPMADAGEGSAGEMSEGAAAGAGGGSTRGGDGKEQVVLQIRLTNGDTLRYEGRAGSTTLAQVLDYIDEHRTDGGQRYQVRTPYPQRTFFSADLDQTLSALGLAGRAALQLEPLPSKAGKAAAPSAAPTQQAKQGDAAQQAPKTPRPTPAVFVLQFKQADGGTLRGEFSPEASLQEVCHYVDAHRTDGGGSYTLVQPYPRRRLGAEGEGGMAATLQQLGLDPRSLLLIEPTAGGEREGRDAGSGGWSLGGLLSYLNPLAYLGTAQHPDPGQQHREGEVGPAGEAGTGAEAPGEEGAERSGGSPGGVRKRVYGQLGGSGSASNIHTLGSDGSEGGGRGGRQAQEGDRDGRNSYWNGNSTQFGGDGDEGRDA